MSTKAKFITASLEDIRLTGDNPRIVDLKSPEFAGLVESIAAQGVVVPVHVRTDPAQKKRYELLAGERRYRAAEKLSLQGIPAIDHGDISDEAAFEITFAENFQREDLTVLEHGRAVAILMKKYKNDYAAVSARLGKDERWVRRHECIETNLIIDFKTAVSAGGAMEYMTAAHLELIARFPAETQKIIYNKLITAWCGTSITVRGLEGLAAGMLRILKKAKFDTGKCQKCTKRSGCQPMLWSDDNDKKSAGDRCLDPACWEKKDIDSEKKKFKARAEKYPGLVGITSDYYLDRDDGKRFRKTYGKVLVKNDYQLCKKTDKDAVPAVNVKGKGDGKIYYIKTRIDTKPAAGKPATLKQRRAELDRNRWSVAIVRMIEKIKAMKFGEICVHVGDNGEMQGDGGIFRMSLLIVLYGCDCVLYASKDRDDFFESTLKLYKSSADMTPAINQVCEKLWPEVAENLEYNVNTNGDEDSKKEGRLLAELFGMDLDAEYKQVCADPEFAEPAEWKNLNADGTEKKVKVKRGKKDEGRGPQPALSAAERE